MLRPPPQLTVSEWAERHRMLGSRASAEPGPWRTNRTPYLKDVMDALSAVHPARRVVFMKGAQVPAPQVIARCCGASRRAPGGRRPARPHNPPLASGHRPLSSSFGHAFAKVGAARGNVVMPQGDLHQW